MLEHNTTNGFIFPLFVFGSMEGVFSLVLMLEWRFFIPSTFEMVVEELEVSV